MIEDVQVRCVRCEGKGSECKLCNGSGYLNVRHDGKVDAEIVELIEVAGDAKLGAWPEAGGTNDQLACIVEGVRFVVQEQRWHRATKGLPNGENST